MGMQIFGDILLTEAFVGAMILAGLGLMRLHDWMRDRL